MNATSVIEQRALELLAGGHQPVTVAAHLGVSQSRISQLVSDPEFAKQLATRKYERAVAATQRDSKWDELEDIYLDRLKQLAPMAFKFNDVLRAVTVINAAKRRGGSPVTEAQEHTEVIPLTLPTSIIQTFQQNIQVNVANQVIQVGSQPLQTIQAKQLEEIAGIVENTSERLERKEVRALGTESSRDATVLPDFAGATAAPATDQKQVRFIRTGAAASKEAIGSGASG